MAEKLPLQIKNLTKRFPGVVALNDVSFTANPGEVLGLIGVNGAGKSTLMNMLGGLLQPDSGEIIIKGKSVKIKNPKVAEKLGIAFIQQEIQVFDNLTAYENILIADLGKWRNEKGLPFLNDKYMKLEAAKFLNMLGCNINVSLKASMLAVGEQQMIQIARALSQGGRILLFDEPTSSLSETEKQNLFGIIKNLKESGYIILYITHYLDEIFEICDRVVALRDGAKTGEDVIENLDKMKIINLMIGRDIESMATYQDRIIGERILEVKNITGEKYPVNVSFDLHKGEILGVWGLLGSGRTELFNTLLGFDKMQSGKIFYGENGDLVEQKGGSFYNHVGYVTEERHYDGLFLKMPIWQNITATSLKKFVSTVFFALNEKKEKSTSLEYMKQVNVKAVDENMIVGKLSGGNQQKVIIAKWFLKNPKIFFMDEPTKGVDIGAKAEIQKLIFQSAAQGMSFVVISSELEEIMAVCDRIIIIDSGEAVCEVAKKDFSKDSLMNGIIRKEMQVIEN